MNLDAAPIRLAQLFDAYVKAFSELNSFLEKEWPEVDSYDPPDLNGTLRYLISAMNSRARASFMLLQAGCHWESEIVLRSHLEAAVKCLTFARREEVNDLLREYWIELQSSSDRKAAIKATHAKKIFPDAGFDKKIFEALENPDWFDVKPNANKLQRRKLDHDWSIPELIKKLESSDFTTKRIKNIRSILHGYGMQSEILHVSAKYYDLLLDRATRSNDLTALENGHYCRQMSDPISLTAFCIVSSLEKLGYNDEKISRPLEIARAFSDLTKPYVENFRASQSDFYGPGEIAPGGF